MDAMTKMISARVGLIIAHPFFGTLALRLKLVEDPKCQTAWVNGVHLGFNPEFIEAMPLAKVKGLVAHEVMHCVFQHITRLNGRNPHTWNIAGDHVINRELLDAGFELPDGALDDTRYAGMSTDAVYSMLPPPPPGGQGSKNGEGQPGGAPDGDPGGCGEVRQIPANSESEIAEQEGEWKTATAQAAQAAKIAGKMPASLEKLITAVINPKLPWGDLLRDLVVKRAKEDYSWMRPDRRFIGQGIILPSLHSEKIGALTIAVDTSGSLSDAELSAFCTEITGILQDLNPEVIHVMYCDTKVQNTEDFTVEDLPLVLKAKGGGGTRFTPVFDKIEEDDDYPECLIYLTDLYCDDFPEHAPDYPVYWITTSGQRDVPFGDVIELAL